MTTSTGRIERGRMALIAYQGHDELTGGLADLLEDLAAYHLHRIGSPEATRTTFTLAALRAAGDNDTVTADLLEAAGAELRRADEAEHDRHR
jgi:hypothetical protein